MGRKPSFCYIHIWGCLAHMLKGKIDKLEFKLKVCLFLGHPKENRGSLFYNTQDKKVFVGRNIVFRVT